MTEFVGTRSPAIPAGIAAGPRPTASIESRRSWIAAGITLGLLTVSFGSPLLAVVGLKPITADLGTARQLVALAGALTWLGTGARRHRDGPAGRARRHPLHRDLRRGDDRARPGDLGQRRRSGRCFVGHGLFIGLLGNGAIYAPLLVYVSRWFDRRRGTALALISSGQYIAGMVWPTLFEQAIARYGWRADDARRSPRSSWSAIADRGPVPAAGRRRRRCRVRGSPTAGHASRRCSACAPILVLAMLCVAGVLLLRADGDAAGPSRRVLQRYRHPGGAGRGDAVGAAGRRLCQPACSGAGMADRIGGLQDGARRLGLPGAGDRGVPD